MAAAMVQAYDIKVLGERLKEKGLVQAEVMALDVYKELKAWIVESAVISATPYDNLVVPFIDQLDALVLPEIDKIDGVKKA
jgi:hypothetical protein